MSETTITPPVDDPDDDPEKQLSQSDVTRLIARESKKAAKAERDRIEAELETSPAEAAKLLKAQRETNEKTQSEADRKMALADEREAKAVARESAADARELRSRVMDALRDEGLSGKAARRAAKSMDDLASDADDDDIEQAIEELREDLPSLFDSEREPKKAPSSVTKRKKDKPASSGTSWDAGRLEAEKRFAPQTSNS